MTDFACVLRFWFEQSTPEQWWKKDPAFDAEICKRFAATHQQAMNGELDAWRDCAEGALAEIIILDQFSRHLYRGQPESFASDALALCLAQAAIRLGWDKQLSVLQRTFLYMPFMHSESREIHKTALKLFESLGNKDNLSYELQHKKIVDRFGRYPHRNTILNRESTPEELKFLEEEGSSF